MRRRCCGDLMHWVAELVGWMCGTCFVAFEALPPYEVKDQDGR